MTFKYSVQFEKHGEDAEYLLCNAIKLTENFCNMFPVSSSSGYVAYRYSPPLDKFPSQEFWYNINESKDEVEACQVAILALMDADLDKPLPISLPLVYDDAFVSEF